jgi:serine/threonine protein kinase
MDADHEQRLADAFADLLDGKSTVTAHPLELTGELATLSEIDRLLEPVPPLPDRLSGHKILGEIGAGGMGRVMLAMDEALNRRVAIKTLAPRFADDSELRARFMDEARAMARLNHPNVARIYSLGPADEPPHFVMEYLAGAPLTVAAAGLDFREKAELLAKVALAVQFLHEQGIVHRDLKPANILVDAELEPRLLDFGLALDLSNEGQRATFHQIAGTPEYLSPEQAGGRPLDGRSDVFSLGTILYELLTGAPPFRSDSTRGLLRAICE